MRGGEANPPKIGDQRGIVDHEIERPGVVGQPAVVDVPKEDGHREPGQPIHDEFISDIAQMDDAIRTIREKRVHRSGRSFCVAVGIGHEPDPLHRP